ncbi:SIS domain-containing protein, partial [bacterium]|nr:SIS domain-containing protein [bacterium]
RAMLAIPRQIGSILERSAQIERIAERYAGHQNFLYLGRGYNFPVALEGALKLKEISYIHAEGYPAAEMKHGPIALIDEKMPVVFIATQDPFYEKILSNMEEVKSRGGRILAIVTEGDTEVRKLADDTLEVPDTLPHLTPLLAVVPLQLLAYYIAFLRGCDVDQPRNLAKSVTVE